MEAVMKTEMGKWKRFHSGFEHPLEQSLESPLRTLAFLLITALSNAKTRNRWLQHWLGFRVN